MTRKHILILGGIWGVVGAIVLWLLSRATYIPAWDQAHHLTVAIAYRDAFWRGFAMPTIYPPLYHWLIAVAYAFVGVRPEAGVVIQIPILALLMLTTYLLGERVAGKKAALLAAGLIAFVPVNIWLYTNIFNDLLSISLFVGTFAILLETNFFTRRGVSLLFGLGLLLNLLTRYTFLVPSLMFVAYAGVSVMRAPNKLRVLGNIVLALLLAAPSLAWYLPHASYIREVLTLFSDPQAFPLLLYGTPGALNVQTFLYYPRAALGREGLGLIPLLLFALATITLLRGKRPRYTSYLLGAIFLSFLLPTLWLDKATKYVALSYPLMLIIIGQWIFSLKKVWRRATMTLLICAMAGNALMGIWKFPAAFDSFWPFLPGLSWPYYTKQTWPIDTIVSDVGTARSSPTSLLVLPDHPFLNHATLGFYAAAQRLPVSISQAILLYDPLADPEAADLTRLGAYDVVFTKSGGDLGIFVNTETTWRINTYLASSESFELVASYDLPDGTKGLLYRRAE